MTGRASRGQSSIYITADSQLQIRASFFEVRCEQIYLLEPNATAYQEGHGGFCARPDGTGART